jgi:hypothetical protein
LVGDDAIETEEGTLYSLTPTDEWTRVDDDDNNGRTIDPIEWTGGDEEFSVNRIPVMAPILAPLLGFLFLRGHISLKNRSYRPLLRASTSPFKSTCLLIRLIGLRLWCR